MKYWDLIKATVLHAVWNFFSNNQLLNEQNRTFIALIPKKMGPQSIIIVLLVSVILFIKSFQSC